MKIESSEKEFQELVEKRKQTLQMEKDKILAKIKKKLITTELIISISGFGILIYTLGVLPSLGIWLVMWGNNMMQSRNIFKENNPFKYIWK